MRQVKLKYDFSHNSKIHDIWHINFGKKNMVMDYQDCAGKFLINFFLGNNMPLAIPGNNSSLSKLTQQ
jgi:hypothetical protein